MPHAPDIENGFIVNTTENENSWTTEIQSILTNLRNDKRIFLGHQCRMENVPILDQSNSINKPDKPFEFLTFSTGENFFQIPSPDTIVTGDLLESHPHIELEGSVFLRPVSSPSWRSRVSCADREIEYIDSEDLYGRLIEGGLPIRKLLIEARFTLNETAYELLSPCRYLNFGNKKDSEIRYLQPIVGYVLYPTTDFFIHAYFAVAQFVGGRNHICEFVLPRYTNAFDRLSIIVGEDESSREYKRLSESQAVYTQVFDVALPVEAELRYFTYH